MEISSNLAGGNMTYLAHIREDSAEQPLDVHIRNCACYASRANIAGLKQAAYLAGLLHDMGKYTKEFQEYLSRAAAGEAVHRGSVNHTFAGVRFAIERWHTSQQPALRDMVCEIIAVAAGAHHGLFDCIDPDGKDGFLHRLTLDDTAYREARDNFLRHCAGTEELDALFEAAETEVTAALEQMKTYCADAGELHFGLGLLTRMLLSAVIDADRRDTAEFMLNTTFPQRECNPDLWIGSLQQVENRLDNLPVQSSLHRVRRAISDQCRAAASRQDGIYRLAIPTGGGKTLSSLRYALAAAAEQGKQRVFFVIPLLSVLEQNAAVIREYIGDDSLILEHHSNVIQEQSTGDKLDRNELLMETWNSPIVITTLVQLLNTLFAGKTSCIRRMQALENSVIVIDEVQSVPRKMLSLFNLAMNFLAHSCHCVILLCSATQPCLERVPHPLRFREPADLVPVHEEWRKAFRRTEILDKRKRGGYTTDELAALIAERMEQVDSLLLICNTKKQAKTLFHSLRLADAEVYHLSTAMCMEHRMNTLAKINHCLQHRRRVVCVATQLVEAGVDFSFACVIRVSAGLDNIVQAAGRCNRSGEFGQLCPVYIVNLCEENLRNLEDIRQSQLAAEALMTDFAEHPERYQKDLSSDQAIASYYRRLYANLPVNQLNYPLPRLQTTLFSLLSTNVESQSRGKSLGKYFLAQAFQTAGKEFRVFDDNTVDVLVPYGDGETIIAELGSDAAKNDLLYRKQLLDQARRFSISLYDYELAALQKSGGLARLYDSIDVLQPGFYSDTTGFDLHGDGNGFLEV